MCHQLNDFASYQHFSSELASSRVQSANKRDAHACANDDTLMNNTDNQALMTMPSNCVQCLGGRTCKVNVVH